MLICIERTPALIFYFSRPHSFCTLSHGWIQQDLLPPFSAPNILFPSNSLTTKATTTRRGRRSPSSVAGQKLARLAPGAAVALECGHAYCNRQTFASSLVTACTECRQPMGARVPLLGTLANVLKAARALQGVGHLCQGFLDRGPDRGLHLFVHLGPQL